MANTFFTSDNHFFHANILKFNPDTRKGESVEEMNELMIEQWNNTVAWEDTVYCLGDFSFGKSLQTIEVLNRLNGNIHLIRGNHDYWVDNKDAKRCLVSLQDYKELKFNSNRFVLFHYPLVTWNRGHYGAFHLYGHVHGSVTLEGRALDVGIDNRPQKDMGLWELSEVVNLLKDRKLIKHHD